MNDNEMHPLDVALDAAITGNLDESEKILRNQPQNDYRVLFNLGWHEMRRGNLKKGFEHLNYGRFIGVFGSPAIPGKIWKNESLENKTLLFRCEGGYGDQIINFRFAKQFEKLGARVLISCSPELKSLFSDHGFICVDNSAISSIHYDYWIPAMSAAYILGLEYEDLKGSPYLFSKNRKKLFSNPGNIKVGVRWSGSPEFEHEQYRRFPPEFMTNLHSVPNTTFYSLQRDENTIDGLPFADMRNQMTTWIETMDIISDLDLVITSCTSVAHLSAAMGKPTWIVLPVLPYYIWSFPGKTSKWYDSVTLFRQKKFGEWKDVFDDIRNELIKISS